MYVLSHDGFLTPLAQKVGFTCFRRMPCYDPLTNRMSKNVNIIGGGGVNTDGPYTSLSLKMLILF